MKDKVETPEKIARANRQRLAADEGAKALELIQKESIAVRKNMERLRALRLQKEASAVEQQIAEPPTKPKRRSARK